MKKLIPVGLTALITALLLFSCSKEYSVENGSMGIPAGGTIQKDSQNNCTAPVIQGTYYSSRALGDTNYVQIQVNITKVGSYKISTDNQNGFSFADSGYFGATGAQTVKLKGKGTPILPNLTDFTVTFDSSSCHFTIQVQDGGTIDPNKSDTAWQFSDPQGNYHGHIDSAFIMPITNAGITFYALILSGSTAGKDSAIQISVSLPNQSQTIQPGIPYSLKDGTAAFVFYKTPQAQPPTFIYTDTLLANNQPQPKADLTVQISSFDNTSRIVTGTFSGTGVTPTQTTVQFTNGRFKARVIP